MMMTVVLETIPSVLPCRNSDGVICHGAFSIKGRRALGWLFCLKPCAGSSSDALQFYGLFRHTHTQLVIQREIFCALFA